MQSSGKQLLSWQQRLEIGVEEIDTQHQEIFRRFNDLLQACNSGKGKEEVVRFLDFLSSYVCTHFASEEKLQLRYGYPFHKEHRQAHQEFIRDLERLRSSLTQEGTGLLLVVETNKTTISWLLNHISQMDKEFGEFLRDKL
jgi:hemerythrin